jgi:hypothetical protein
MLLAGSLSGVLALLRVSLLLLGIVGLTVAYSEGATLRLWAFAVGLIWVALWSPCALISARLGRMVEVWWWPILPLVTPPLVIARTAQILFSRRGGKLAAQLARTVIAVGFVVGLYYGLSGLVAGLNVQGYLSEAAVSWLPVSTRDMLLGMFALFYLLLLAVALVRWTSVWILLHRLGRGAPVYLSGEQLLQHVQRLHSAGQLLRLLQTVRSRRLISPEGETLQAVKDLFVTGEHLRRIHRRDLVTKGERRIWQRVLGFLTFEVFSRSARTKLRQAWTDDSLWPEFSTLHFHAWLSRNANQYRRIRNLLTDIDVVDEMSRLIDDLERPRAGQFGAEETETLRGSA